MSLYHWIWLTQQVPNPVQGNRLLEIFQKPERIYSATQEQLLDTRILSREQCFQLSQAHTLEPALHIMNHCSDLGIQLLTLHDTLYPERLRNISNPPLLLYIRGRLPLFDDLLSIALVGTRHASSVSLRNAENFAYALGRRGICHISGMADGIDSAGHYGALRAGAMSVAVFGCGPDVCYPAGNRRLMDRLEQEGCIISEYAPGTPPSRASFPRRNRIIAGLSTGVIILAAPHRSGSLITANLATEFGRDVFVVPGGISDPEFGGANELIKDGATPVTTPEDILHYYGNNVTYTSQYPSRVPQSDYEATREEHQRNAEPEAKDTPCESTSFSESVEAGSESLTEEKALSENALPSADAESPSEKEKSSEENVISEVEDASGVKNGSDTAEKDDPAAKAPVFREVPFGVSLRAWLKAHTGYDVSRDNDAVREDEDSEKQLSEIPEERGFSETAEVSETVDFSDSAHTSQFQEPSESAHNAAAFPPLSPKDATELRVAVYEAVCGGISVPDVLVSHLNRPIDDVLSALADLEILGYLRSMPGGNMIPNLK